MRCLARLLFVVVALPVTVGAETLAITGADIHTLGSAGTVRNGTLLLRDGVLVDVGVRIEIPDGAVRIDAANMTITPGLVDVVSTLGVHEVSLESSTVDYIRPVHGPSAAFSLASAINPDSIVIDVVRAEGVTHAVVAPALPYDVGEQEHPEPPFAGQGTFISLGADVGFIKADPVAVFAAAGNRGSSIAGGSRAAALASIDAALALAADQRDGQDVSSESLTELGLERRDLTPLTRVLERQIPLVVALDRAVDIRALIATALRHNVRVVVNGGAEAWRVADDLAAADIPVIVYPQQNLPSTFDALDATLTNASRLAASGVRVAIAERGSHNAGNLRQSAGNAVANGMPWIDGLAAITSVPAAIYGLDGAAGSLVVGEPASFVVWDGDPLEVTSVPVHVFIEGQKAPLVSRQTKLRDRYHPSRSAERPRAYPSR